MTIDIAALRVAKHGELARLYIAFRKNHAEAEITKHVLEAVQDESLPVTVVHTWLVVSQSYHAIAEALQQDYSCMARNVAIKEFGRHMCTKSWESVWNELGGVKGVLALFARFSVLDVKRMAASIGDCNRGQVLPSREQKIEQLLRYLLKVDNADNQYSNDDNRPLLHHYARVVPACSSDFIMKMLAEPNHPLLRHLNFARIAKSHPRLAQEQVFRSVESYDFDSYERFGPSLPLLTHSIPSSRRDQNGFSSTMSFALKVLVQLSEETQLGVDDDKAIKQIAAPLLARAVKYRLAEGCIVQIVETTLKYLEQAPTAAIYFLPTNSRYAYYGDTYSRGTCTKPFLRSLVKYWSMSGATMNKEIDGLLTNCLGLYGNESSSKNISGLAQDLFLVVKRAHRHMLLCHIMKHCSRPSVDLESEDEQQDLKIEKLPCSLFINMGNLDALRLLKRLIQGKNDSPPLALDADNSIFNHPPTPDGSHADSSLVRTYLGGGKPGALVQAERDTRELQRKSAASREQTDRAFYARSAMFYAIASGSLKLYNEVLTWSRRYIRDPLTVKTLFGRQSLLTTQGVNLLSGIFDRSNQGPSISVDEWQVTEANEILVKFLLIACSSLNEPSFDVNDWGAVKGIYRHVIGRRLELASLLQQRHGIAGDVLDEKIWKNTIATLIHIEKVACSMQNARLDYNYTTGPLGHPPRYHVPVVKSDTFSEASFRFLDALAKARNQLWKEMRPQSHPAILSIGGPWPRGLPFQCLIAPFDLKTPDARDFTSYLSSRAAEIVYLAKDIAMSAIPADEESRAAIGCFVDDYNVALHFLVMQQPGRTRWKQANQAWEHAMSSLAHPRQSLVGYSSRAVTGNVHTQEADYMDENEAIRTWRLHFQRTLPSVNLSLPYTEEETRLYPVLPPADDTNEVVEWNPQSNKPQAVKSRSLSATAIDSMLHNPPAHGDMLHPFQEPRAVTAQFTPQPVWNFDNMEGRKEEGLIASTLLYLDSTENKTTRLLAKPFPSHREVRYPALILDHDFLLDQDLAGVQVIQVLRVLIDRVPSSLLHDLTKGIMESSARSSIADTNATISTSACQLLALLTKSDRPHTATDLILRTIIDRPETSSWHRQFLSSTLLCRLSRYSAHQLLLSFTTLIEAKLKEQKDSGFPDGKEQKRTVKVTTVKYLAQLLKQAQFISSKDSLNILVSLLQKSSHRDIQCAIVESMLALLTQYGTSTSDDVDMKDLITDALRAVVPVASRLTERLDLSQRFWSELKDDDQLPAIEDEETIPPLMGLLIDSATRRELTIQLRRFLVDELILPAFEACRTAYSQWLNTFLRRHTEVQDWGALRLTYPRPKVLIAMLESIPELLPMKYFEEWHDYVERNLEPSANLLQLNQTLRLRLAKADQEDNESTLDTKAIQHWLYIHDPGASVSVRFLLAKLLRNELRSGLTLDDDTISRLQRLVVKQADILIVRYDKLYEHWTMFLGPLKRVEKQAWYDNCKPVLEELLARVDYHRNNLGSKSDRNWKSSFLPSGLRLRLYLLPSGVNNKYHDLAAEVVELLKEIIASQKTYHQELQVIYTHVLDHLAPTSSDGTSKFTPQLDVACYFGELPSIEGWQPQTIDFIRVEMAHRLLRKSEQYIRRAGEYPGMRDRAERMLARWRDSHVEEFRMRGCIGFGYAAWGSLD